MPPSLSVSAGVPPATVTASLMFNVSVTTLPTLRSPLPLLIPVPVVATEVTVGDVEPIVTFNDPEVAPVLPVISVSVAVKAWLPLGSAVVV